MSRKTWIIIAAVVVLLGGALAWHLMSVDGSSGEAVAASANYSPLPTDHTAGNPKAKVTLIEYASPTCPACAYFMMNFYPRLKKDYIDTGKIFFVYRAFLRLADDGAAEKLARCLPKEKYMDFHHTLYANQAKWDYEFGIPQPEGVRAALIELAGTAGMSPAEADRCLTDPKDEAAISKVGEDGVARYNVGGTPTFVINGKAEVGFNNFFERLDAALAQ